MSLSYTQPTGGTLTYPNTIIGGSSNGSIQVTHAGSDLDDVNSITISGPGAAAYSITPPNNIFTGYFDPGDSATDIVKFSPTSATTFNATFTVNYSQYNSNGQLVFTANISLALMGVGITGGATGEAPALVQSFRRELVPVNSLSAGIVLAYFNELNFNEALDGRSYIFRAEDILADRVPTVRPIIVTYIDLGVATVTATINGVDDNGTPVTAASTVTIGTAAASGNLLTKFIDLQATCFRPQLTLSQVAGGGPFQMSTAVITGTVEKEVTL